MVLRILGAEVITRRFCSWVSELWTLVGDLGLPGDCEMGTDKDTVGLGMDASRESPVYHYHSNYDSYHWMKSMVDPDFGIHTTAGRFIALLAYHLADDALIPFDMDTYARNINYWIRELVGETMGMPDSGTVQRKIKMSELAAAGRRLRQIATDFTDRTSELSFLDDAARVQKANRVMKDVQRLFVRQEGLPGRQFYKNGMYAPNRDDGKLG